MVTPPIVASGAMCVVCRRTASVTVYLNVSVPRKPAAGAYRKEPSGLSVSEPRAGAAKGAGVHGRSLGSPDGNRVNAA